MTVVSFRCPHPGPGEPPPHPDALDPPVMALFTEGADVGDAIATEVIAMPSDPVEGAIRFLGAAGENYWLSGTREQIEATIARLTALAARVQEAETP